MKIKTSLLVVAMVAGWSTGAAGNETNTLFEIDIAKLSAVTISATDAAPESDSAANTWDGILLAGLFAEAAVYVGDAFAENGAVPDLTANGAMRAYNRAQSSSLDRDLNLYYASIKREHTFATGAPAFSGSLSLDLTDTTFNPQYVGDVLNGAGREKIGQWVIVNAGGELANADGSAVNAVPAPAMLTLIMFGLVGIGYGRRRGAVTGNG